MTAATAPRTRLALLAAVALMGTLLAGCSGGEETFDEVVLGGATASGNQTAPSTLPQEGGGVAGHLAGVVVDEGIHPIEGALVRLPYIDLQDFADRNGGFSFTDLPIGSYLVKASAAGYDSAEALVEIKENEFTRVKFVLHAQPPAKPHVTVEPFTGFSAASIPFLAVCDSRCDVPLRPDKPNLHALVVDLKMDHGSLTGDDSFEWDLYDANGTFLRSGSASSPGQVRFKGSDVQNWSTPLTMRVWVFGMLGGVDEKKWNAYISSWYSVDVPAGWTFPKDGNPYP